MQGFPIQAAQTMLKMVTSRTSIAAASAPLVVQATAASLRLTASVECAKISAALRRFVMTACATKTKRISIAAAFAAAAAPTRRAVARVRTVRAWSAMTDSAARQAAMTGSTTGKRPIETAAETAPKRAAQAWAAKQAQTASAARAKTNSAKSRAAMTGSTTVMSAPSTAAARVSQLVQRGHPASKTMIA